MTAGDILLHSHFKYEDGTVGGKLLVILNSPDTAKNEPYLFVKTTSRLKGKQLTPGCIAAWGIFYIPPHKDFFDDHTVLDLRDIREIDPTSLVKDHFDGSVNKVNQLSFLTISQLKNCLKQIKEDISEKHYTLIFKK